MTKVLIQCQPGSKTKLRIIEQDLVKIAALSPVVYHSLGLPSEGIAALDVWQDRPATSQMSAIRPGETREVTLTETYRVILEEVPE